MIQIIGFALMVLWVLYQFGGGKESIERITAHPPQTPKPPYKIDATKYPLLEKEIERRERLGIE